MQMGCGIRWRFRAVRRDLDLGSMSLINDALKTAQRERSGQVKGGSGSQPLLEGFFPYVSTGSAKSQPNRARVALAAGGGLVVLVVGLWFAMPAIRLALKSAPKPQGIVAPAGQVSPPTATPPETQQVAAAAETTSVAAPSAPVATENPPVEQETQRRARTRPTIAAADGGGSKRASIAQPAESLARTPDRGGFVSVESPRPNLEPEAVTAFNAGDYRSEEH